MNITEKLKDLEENEDHIEEGSIEPSDFYNNNYISNNSIDYDNDEEIENNMNDDVDFIVDENNIENIENYNEQNDNNNSFISIDSNYETNIEDSINNENDIDEKIENENNIDNYENNIENDDKNSIDVDENSKEELNNIKEIIETLKFERINENKINNNLEITIKENISNTTINIQDSFANLENKILFLENSIKELINIIKNISTQNISQMKEQTLNPTTNLEEENNNQKNISNATIKNNNLNIDNYAIISKRTTKIYINNKLVDEILNIIEELPIVPTKDHILDMKLIENDFKYFVVGEELSEKMYGISSKSNIQIDNKLFFTIMYKYINTFYQNVNLIKKDI